MTDISKDLKEAIEKNLPQMVGKELQAVLADYEQVKNSEKLLMAVNDTLTKENVRLRALELLETNIRAMEAAAIGKECSLATKEEILKIRKEHAKQRVDEICGLTDTVFRSNRFNMDAQWLKPIDGVLKDLPENCWIAGGCMRSFLCGEKPKDIDIFSPKPDEIVAALEAKDGFKKSFGNEFFQNFKHKDLTYQVIKKYVYATPQETIDSFDFTLISAAYSKEGLVCHERFYLDNAQRRLVIHSLPLPLSTMKRALKYAARDYMLCPVSLSRLVRTINELKIDWENPDQNQIDFYPDGTPTFRGKD